MSSRFRIRSGDTEIEFEGSAEEVSSRYKEAFDWLKTVPAKPSEEKVKNEHKPDSKTKAGEEQKQGKADSRGGARSAVISPAIDELIKEGFLDSWKTAEEVITELRRKGTPVSSTDAVDEALKRRVRAGSMDRTKNEQGKWLYRKKT
jgi:hypothetical protein